MIVNNDVKIIILESKLFDQLIEIFLN